MDNTGQLKIYRLVGNIRHLEGKNEIMTLLSDILREFNFRKGEYAVDKVDGYIIADKLARLDIHLFGKFG